MSPSSETPFRILVLGDFSGRASRAAHAPAELGSRPVHAVDRDELDDLFARLGVRVRVAADPAGEPLELALGQLDQCHPDHLYESVPTFARLRDLRGRLADPATFQAAAAELGQGPPQPARPAPREDAPTPPASDLLEATLEATQHPGAGAGAGTGSELVDALLRELVIPHLTPAPDPRRDELLAAVDAATGAHMRGLLHAEHLRGVEASWRALEWLVRRLETGPRLQVHLLDASRAELEADLALGSTGSRLARRLVDGSLGQPGAQPWSLLLGAFTFDARAADLTSLAALADLAAELGAAFVAAGHPRLAGIDSLVASADPDDWTRPLAPDAGQLWAALRTRPQAERVALMVPRFLLRLPYGERGELALRFRFEELTGADDHEGYLWGSGAFAAALYLGERFSLAGWDLRTDASLEIRGLPCDVRIRDGEPTAQAIAEVLLSDRAAGRLVARGLSPVRSVRGQDVVRLDGLHSIAGTLLSGPWKAGGGGVGLPDTAPAD